MKPVTIVGAGFSGLTLAYELDKRGVPVELIEREPRVGGLIATRKNPFGIVETAAHALLADAGVESLFEELGVSFASRRRARKNRYVFVKRPRRWPLGWRSTLRVLRLALGIARGQPGIFPEPYESVRDWARRVADKEFEKNLLAPALKGVFAADSSRLSARLAMGALWSRGKKGRWKGSVAPSGGMGQLIEALETHLHKRGVKIHTLPGYVLPRNPDAPVVLCTSAWDAAGILRSLQPALAKHLERCESLPLVAVTAFFPRTERDLDGFGCLFPKLENFTASGVLFNGSVFSGREEGLRSETWIFGGDDQPEAVTWSDGETLTHLLRDRRRLNGQDDEPAHFEVTRWPRAIPCYSVDWERALDSLKVPAPLYLHGNYMGALGLARILDRSRKLAQTIKENYRG